MNVIMKSFIFFVINRNKIPVDFVHDFVAETQIIHNINQCFTFDFIIKIFEIN